MSSAICLKLDQSKVLPFGNELKDWKKKLWEKEKMLVTSIFSFSHSVFKRLLSWGRLKLGFYGKELTKLEAERLID